MTRDPMKNVKHNSKLATVVRSESLLPEMGRQIAAQYEVVTKPTPDHLLFWAMIERFKAQAEREMREGLIIGDTDKKRGRPSKPTDLKNLIQVYCPGVLYDTARRHHEFGAFIVRECAERLGYDCESVEPLARLLCSPGDDLSPRDRTKQRRILDAARGTDKKSWLDSYRINKERGGNNHPKCRACGGNLRSHTQPTCPHCGIATGAPSLSHDAIEAMHNRDAQAVVNDVLEQITQTKKRPNFHYLLRLPLFDPNQAIIDLTTLQTCVNEYSKAVADVIKMKRDQARKSTEHGWKQLGRKAGPSE